MFPFKKSDDDLNRYYMREGLLATILISLIIGGVAGGIVGATVSGSFRYFPRSENQLAAPRLIWKSAIP